MKTKYNPLVSILIANYNNENYLTKCLSSVLNQKYKPKPFDAGKTLIFGCSTLLIESNSFVASEIVASALQDNGRAVVLGDRTFGKASVQTLFSPLLRDDYYIKLSVARYYRPSGDTLQVVGVRPDEFIPPDHKGEMPLGFREENLSNHLAPLDADKANNNTAYSAGLVACVERTGKAASVHASDPNPAVKFDNQLMVAADYLMCMQGGR